MKISIITITYNSEKTLEDTIKSVIGQNYDDALNREFTKSLITMQMFVIILYAIEILLLGICFMRMIYYLSLILNMLNIHIQSI